MHANIYIDARLCKSVDLPFSRYLIDRLRSVQDPQAFKSTDELFEMVLPEFLRNSIIRITGIECGII